MSFTCQSQEKKAPALAPSNADRGAEDAFPVAGDSEYHGARQHLLMLAQDMGLRYAVLTRSAKRSSGWAGGGAREETFGAGRGAVGGHAGPVHGGGAGGEQMLGRRLEMYWPAEEEWFHGTIIKVHVSGQHIVEWEDHEISIHDLDNENIRWISERPQGDDEAVGPAAADRRDRLEAEEECELLTPGQGFVGNCEPPHQQIACQEDQDEADSSMPPGLEERDKP